jgi:hypothetical protein
MSCGQFIIFEKSGRARSQASTEWQSNERLAIRLHGRLLAQLGQDREPMRLATRWGQLAARSQISRRNWQEFDVKEARVWIADAA